jgi:PIN domain nuclease of toxin-antitoxin system
VKLLLDTHIWIWSLLEPGRLSRRVVRELENRANELWLSPISTWELMVLCDKGRVVSEEPVEEWISRAMEVVPLREAPLTHEVALETRGSRLPYKDPVDHFLGATARVMGLTLVTADERLIRARQFPTLANR